MTAARIGVSELSQRSRRLGRHRRFRRRTDRDASLGSILRKVSSGFGRTKRGSAQEIAKIAKTQLAQERFRRRLDHAGAGSNFRKELLGFGRFAIFAISCADFFRRSRGHGSASVTDLDSDARPVQQFNFWKGVPLVRSLGDLCDLLCRLFL